MGGRDTYTSAITDAESRLIWVAVALDPASKTKSDVVQLCPGSGAGAESARLTRRHLLPQCCSRRRPDLAPMESVPLLPLSIAKAIMCATTCVVTVRQRCQQTLNRCLCCTQRGCMGCTSMVSFARWPCTSDVEPCPEQHHARSANMNPAL